MALIELVEKAADIDLVREMLAFAADRMMDAELETETGAAKGARTPLRENQRNGYRERDWDSRAGHFPMENPGQLSAEINRSSEDHAQAHAEHDNAVRARVVCRVRDILQFRRDLQEISRVVAIECLDRILVERTSRRTSPIDSQAGEVLPAACFVCSRKAD